jgi:hypothetical protein
MPTVVYTTSVGAAVTGDTAEGFAREVDRVLADPRGWRKYGYTFVRSADARALRIRLETSANADALCRATGFSCQRPRHNDIEPSRLASGPPGLRQAAGSSGLSEPSGSTDVEIGWTRRPEGPRGSDIIIHEGNWTGHSKSQLPIERYHNYVVNREVGHALGLDHQSCPIAECERRGLKTCPRPSCSSVREVRRMSHRVLNQIGLSTPIGVSTIRAASEK